MAGDRTLGNQADTLPEDDREPPKRGRATRRRPPTWGLTALAFLALIAIAYVGLGTAIELRYADDWDRVGSATVQRRAMEVMVTMWFAFLGGCFGSFLNVVIYRLPAGKTLMGNSGCPRCGHAIRPQHNIPIIGWLFLQGKCRDCSTPISIRYPIVEALVASVFLSLALLEIYPGGANLPNFARSPFPGVVGVVLDPDWAVISIAVFHAGILTALISWAYIAYDRHPIPRPYGICVVVTTMLLTLLFDHLVPVANLTTGAAMLGRILTGFAIGGLSWFAGAIRGRSEARLSWRSVVASYVVIALAVGAWATISAFVLEGLIRVILFRLDRRGRLPWGLAAPFGLLIQILLWRWLAAWSWCPNPESPIATTAWISVALALNIAAVRR